MDKSSHFNFGMNSQSALDSGYNFNEIAEQDEAMPSFSYQKDHSHNAAVDHHELHRYNSDNNWRSHCGNIECKQENEVPSFVNNLNENSNYGSETEFNDSYQYAHNPISSTYSTDPNSATTSAHNPHKHNSAHQHSMGPYQLSSTKSQLPSWYNPSYQQSPSFLEHPYQYHQGGYMGMQSPSVDHGSMRNMMHLSSRYFWFPFLLAFAQLINDLRMATKWADKLRSTVHADCRVPIVKCLLDECRKKPEMVQQEFSWRVEWEFWIFMTTKEFRLIPCHGFTIKINFILNGELSRGFLKKFLFQMEAPFNEQLSNVCTP